MTKHSGFVAMIGRPNVGKSTLLNHMIGEKLAGVSERPQTTREIIRGILSREEGQILFQDTPGLHKPHDLLGNWMTKNVKNALDEIDLIYFLVLPVKPHPYEEKILDMLQEAKKPVILLVNQIDRFPKRDILPVLEHYHKAYPFKELIPISAKNGDQVDLLIEKTYENLPEGPPLFPEDQISDQTERFLVSEIIREKLFHFTEKEVPYATTVVIDEFKERDEKLTDITATIIVEKDSQKAIVVGKQGSKTKQIGQAAREDIERLVQKKVFLQLWVKTVENWKRDQNILKRLGYG